MAERPDTLTQHSKERIVPRTALITPSASPPAPRASSSAARTKSVSRPPPSKRARVYSSSSSPQPSNRASSSSSRAEPVDPTRDEAWRASSKRLLDVWSSLAERYNVPLDQDDIIDLRTVELVKDRGVVRRAKSTFDIGYFGDPRVDENDGEPSQGAEVEEVQEDEEEEEGDDEIDAFASEPSVPVKIEMEKLKRHVPPFRAADPDDASDLREFLEEERRRREMEGEDADRDEESDIANLLELHSSDDGESRNSRPSSPGTGLSTRDVGQSRASPERSRRSHPPPAARRVIAESALLVPEGDSDDELAICDVEEPTPVAATPRPPLSRARSTGRVIDLTTPSPLSSPSTRGRSKSRARLMLPPDSPPSPLHQHLETMHLSSAGALSPTASRIRSRTMNIQLQTPPSSHSASSAGPDSTPDIRSSPVLRWPSSPSKSKVARAEMPSIASSSRVLLPPANVTNTQRPQNSLAPRHIVEVVVPTLGSLRRSLIMSHPPPQDTTDDEIAPSTRAKPTKASPVKITPSQVDYLLKSKGKAKESKRLPVFEDLSDDEPLPPPPRMRRSTTQPPRSSVGTSTGRRKRKRSSTSSANTSSPDQPLGSTAPVANGRSDPKLQRSPSEPARTRSNAEVKRKGKASRTYDDESGVFCLPGYILIASPHCNAHQQIPLREVTQTRKIDGDRRLSHDPPSERAASLRYLHIRIHRNCIQHFRPRTSIKFQISVTFLILLSRRYKTLMRSTILPML